MRSTMRRCAWCAVVLLTACVGEHDYFYTLNPLPDARSGALATPATHALLAVTVPSLVDRSEMVIQNGAHGVEVLDHRRWGEPLADQVAQTLARDLEQRRTDLLIAGRGFDQPGIVPLKIKVEIVRMTARMGGQATIEAHWRVENGTIDVIGGDSFSASLGGPGYDSVAIAYSETLAQLAERLAAVLPR